jgi:hypothetical protein
LCEVQYPGRPVITYGAEVFADRFVLVNNGVELFMECL